MKDIARPASPPSCCLELKLFPSKIYQLKRYTTTKSFSIIYKMSVQFYRTLDLNQ